MEIERKYLVLDDLLSDLCGVFSYNIEQHYVSLNEFGGVILGERKYPEKDKFYFIYVRSLENPLIEIPKESYLALGGKKTVLADEEVRIRKCGDVHIFTIKSGGTFLREEKEVCIAPEIYDCLFSAAKGRTVEKKRYEIQLEGGRVAELDVYGGKHKGLKTVEVEFENRGDCGSFVPPAWFGGEITEDLRFKNRNLCTQAHSCK
ncbi:MAG: hypothetical protein KAI53_02075 [Candidatus Aenigmarchaeota archaeon]|nr:hypothetical protein [Candidatus Aenigmarchaeota archaeon]